MMGGLSEVPPPIPPPGATAIKRFILLAAFATLGLAGRADASFSYVSTPTLSSITNGSQGGTALTVTPISSTVPLTTPTNVNLFNISVASTTTTGTDTFTANFNHVLSITNIPPPGTPTTGSISFNVSLTFTRSDATGSLSFATTPVSVSGVVDGVVYTLDNFVYAPPTTGTTGPGVGNLSARITSSAVPEPASLALVGLGLGGVGLVARRRRMVV